MRAIKSTTTTSLGTASIPFSHTYGDANLSSDEQVLTVEIDPDNCFPKGPASSVTSPSGGVKYSTLPFVPIGLSRPSFVASLYVYGKPT